jgi:hypothetical protein
MRGWIGGPFVMIASDIRGVRAVHGRTIQINLSAELVIST